ncbi:MAG: hypothetical protein QXP42_05670, partial [Candidatus Micrarchaeia archaeon]
MALMPRRCFFAWPIGDLRNVKMPALKALEIALRVRDRWWEFTDIRQKHRGLAEAYRRILDRYIANNPIVLQVETRNVYDERGEIDFSRWRLVIPNLRENAEWVRYVFASDP